ncbi:hypothetical protein AXF42_Ash018123 [Apostasia shenzhenica]|uniref:Uncharacterized protein n=1 Tax=Apostasia shenzhenica TaxID=1088818 RepID=A0A2I0AF09_9ASPA|nr:hypothetical protein AXF42_Ash018123 [Apostasia shenzhenica]
MVISAETAPAPSAPPSRRVAVQTSLHSFEFPVLKTWGKHRVLRFLNVNRKGEIIDGARRSGASEISASSADQIWPEEDSVRAGDDAGFEEVRAKLLVHLQEAAERMKVDVPQSEQRKPGPPSAMTLLPAPSKAPKSPEPSSSSSPGLARPWNLRTRRVPIYNEPRNIASPSPLSQSVPSEKSALARTVRLRSEGLERREWPKITIPLTREEIDEDIYAVTGSRGRRRPKKRPRILQRQLDFLLPGLWLPSITPDSYRVPDLP